MITAKTLHRVRIFIFDAEKGDIWQCRMPVTWTLWTVPLYFFWSVTFIHSVLPSSENFLFCFSLTVKKFIRHIYLEFHASWLLLHLLTSVKTVRQLRVLNTHTSHHTNLHTTWCQSHLSSLLFVSLLPNMAVDSDWHTCQTSYRNGIANEMGAKHFS